MAQPKAGAFQGVRALSHLGIAVKSIESTLGFFEGVLGLSCEHVEEVSSQKVRAAFLPLGATRLELLEPTAPESPIARFLEKRGEGLHHIAFEVEDAGAALEGAKAQGVRLVDASPRPGARGCLVGFLHPASCHGVLVEFVEEP
ncbi:MAG TPA: methylmalonyl-CoA epimerase [Candidatus Thermoplasmatota archaeon]|nr:methylmalonyl-CoA epimerase [Candidatus Thermoplasmatota archaeon]